MKKLYLAIFIVLVSHFAQAQVTSVASGNWNSGSTWSTGAVPDGSSQVIISAGHTITIDAASAAGSLVINAGGTLDATAGPFSVSNTVVNSGAFNASGANINIGGVAAQGFSNHGTANLTAGSLTIGPAGGGNRTLLNTGTLVHGWCQTLVNGNLRNTGNFVQDNGSIRVDGNAAGVLANSVAAGTHLLEFSNSSNNLQLNGGGITIVDPHASSSTSTYAVYANISDAAQVEATVSHFVHLGEFASTTAGGNPNGINLNLRAGPGNLALGGITVQGGTSNNRHVTSVHPLVIRRDIRVVDGAELLLDTDVYIARDVNIIGIATVTGKVAFTQHNLVTGVSAPTPFRQHVVGTFRNAVTGASASFNKLMINTHAEVMFDGPYSIADTLWLLKGRAVTPMFTLGTSPSSIGTIMLDAGTVAGDLKRYLPANMGSYLYPVMGSKVTLNYTTAPSSAGAVTIGLLFKPEKLTDGLPLVQGTMVIDTIAVDTGSYPGPLKVVAANGLTGGTYNLTYEWNPATVNTDSSKLVLLFRDNQSMPWKLEGTHVTTTGSSTDPVLNRTGISSYGEFNIGRSTISTSTPVVHSVASGNWDSGSTWNTGMVPNASQLVLISAGDSISITTNAVARDLQVASGGILNIGANSLTIDGNIANGGTIRNSGGNITINGAAGTGYSSTNSGALFLSSGTIKLGPDGGGNRHFSNSGTVVVNGGSLLINGSLHNQPSSPFVQTGGSISVDGNAAGDSSNSVPAGMAIVQFLHNLSTASGINLSGGLFTIVDPHASPTESSALNVNISDDVLSTGNHVLRFGDGTSADMGGSPVGFRIDDGVTVLQALKLANVTLEATSVANRRVTTRYNIHVTGNLTIKAGAEYKPLTYTTSSGVVSPTTRISGDFVIDSLGTATIAGTLLLGPTPNPQSFVINGIIRASDSTAAGTINSLQVDKTYGTITFNNNLSVNHKLELISGTLDMQGHTLTLGYCVCPTVSFYAQTGIVANGKFRRYLSASTGIYNFPVGSLTRTRYATIEITTAPINGGTLTAEWVNTYGGTSGLPLTEGTLVIDSTSRSGYWRFTAANGLAGGSYKATFKPNDILGYTDPGQLVLLKRDNSGAPWTLNGTHVPVSGSFVTPTISRTDMNGFGEFGIGIGTQQALPVTLVSFAARPAANNTIALNWTVTQQSGIQYYIVERSSDGSNFSSIGKVQANGSVETSYNFTDAQPVAGKNYYRLKIVDVARESYSAIAIATLKTDAGLAIYPVPAKDVMTVKAGSENIGKELLITDMHGKVLQRFTIRQPLQQVNISTLATGTYMLKAGDDYIRFIKL